MTLPRSSPRDHGRVPDRWHRAGRGDPWHCGPRIGVRDRAELATRGRDPARLPICNLALHQHCAPARHRHRRGRAHHCHFSDERFHFGTAQAHPRHALGSHDPAPSRSVRAKRGTAPCRGDTKITKRSSTRSPTWRARRPDSCGPRWRFRPRSSTSTTLARKGSEFIVEIRGIDPAAEATVGGFEQWIGPLRPDDLGVTARERGVYQTVADPKNPFPKYKVEGRLEKDSVIVGVSLATKLRLHRGHFLNSARSAP